MGFVYCNPNPIQNIVGDCVIRGIAILSERDWDSVYMDIAYRGLLMKDMPSSNRVWGAYLSDEGYLRKVIPNTCPDCYTISDFAYDHPHGRYLVATGTHVVGIVDGNYYDTWNSGDEVPIYYWVKETRDESVYKNASFGMGESLSTEHVSANTADADKFK